jgi:hypothetical protein
MINLAAATLQTLRVVVGELAGSASDSLLGRLCREQSPEAACAPPSVRPRQARSLPVSELAADSTRPCSYRPWCRAPAAHQLGARLPGHLLTLAGRTATGAPQSRLHAESDAQTSSLPELLFRSPTGAKRDRESRESERCWRHVNVNIACRPELNSSPVSIDTQLRSLPSFQTHSSDTPKITGKLSTITIK